jgi:ABC-type transport system involved in multi-copper enzyme maturation permease subunit
MFTIASAVVLDAIRRKVVWVVLVFAGIMSLVIPALPSYGAGVVSAVFREVSIALMFVAAFVVSLALSATRVPVEVERRTVFNILSRDVRRWHYVVGTWLGMCAVIGLSVVLFALIVIVDGVVVYGQFMPALLEAGLAIWLEMGVLMAFTLMVSTRLGAVTTVVASLAFMFVGHSVGQLFTGGREGVAAPWYVPSLDVFNVINPVAHGSGFGWGYAASMLLVFAAWVAILLSIGSAMFATRDL